MRGRQEGQMPTDGKTFLKRVFSGVPKDVDPHFFLSHPTFAPPPNFTSLTALLVIGRGQLCIIIIFMCLKYLMSMSNFL